MAPEISGIDANLGAGDTAPNLHPQHPVKHARAVFHTSFSVMPYSETHFVSLEIGEGSCVSQEFEGCKFWQVFFFQMALPVLYLSTWSGKQHFM